MENILTWNTTINYFLMKTCPKKLIFPNLFRIDNQPNIKLMDSLKGCNMVPIKESKII